MNELPTMPLPRVFTIPAPAQPERTPRRRWSFLPVLQAATALVALLLFFAMTGDFLLSGSGRGSIPEPMLMQEQAPIAVEEPHVVGLVMESEVPAAAPEAEVVVEKAVAETAVVKTVVETVEVEMEVEVAATAPSPMTQPPLAAEPASGEARATMPQEGGVELAESVGEESLSDEAAGESQAKAAPAEQAAATEEPGTSVALGGGGPTPAVLASPQPRLSRDLVAPTIVAEAPAAAPAVPEVKPETLSQTWREPGINWLRVVEIVLAVALISLVTITLIATIQRRKAR
jgi:hypothetical protein